MVLARDEAGEHAGLSFPVQNVGISHGDASPWVASARIPAEGGRDDTGANERPRTIAVTQSTGCRPHAAVRPPAPPTARGDPPPLSHPDTSRRNSGPQMHQVCRRVILSRDVMAALAQASCGGARVRRGDGWAGAFTSAPDKLRESGYLMELGLGPREARDGRPVSRPVARTRSPLSLLGRRGHGARAGPRQCRGGRCAAGGSAGSRLAPP